VVFGGVNMDPQTEQLRRGVEILIATPGRLLDHVQQKTVSFNKVEILVLDEADRMLDMGFINDIRKIMGLLPKQRQTLLFSATFAPEIKKLAEDFMHDTELVEVARRNATNEQIEQTVYHVDSHRKRYLLAHLIKSRQMSQVIVFCKTKQGADQLARDLKRDGLPVEAIHGDKAQGARLETLANFKSGELQVLVATDVAARGLDISELPYVVNFELPNAPEDYVHRIGRTGRAGATGVAISLMGADESRQLEAIERLTRQKLTPQAVDGFWPSWIPRPAQPKPEPSRSSSYAAAPAAVAGNNAVRAVPRRNRVREVPALLLPPRYKVESTRGGR
jgi:superfamily II DNA/RNA helicase